jgi:hypothetical protein
MKRNFKIHTKFIDFETQLHQFISNYDISGTPFGNQKRNSLRLFELNKETLNIKSFRVPNIFNQIAYKFFRKSKAQRSFEYANRLTDLGIDTPQPIAYYEYKTPFLFKKSYYISKHLDCDLTYRELSRNPDYPEHEIILRAFTRFTYNLHENNVNFLDHSPGNTLIKKVDGTYQFYLVDLNRMNFEPMSYEDRIKNFAKLTTNKDMIAVMSDEYAKCSDVDSNTVKDLMWQYMQEFQEKHQRKGRLKKKLKFWKK